MHGVTRFRKRGPCSLPKMLKDREPTLHKQEQRQSSSAGLICQCWQASVCFCVTS